jgi:hypothetical protein
MFTKILSTLFETFRAYHKAEDEIYERAVNNLESKNSPKIFLIIFVVFVAEWLFVIFDVYEPRELINNHLESLIFIPYLTSYFFFYLGSKFVFRPTEEELTDDTSIIPMFSACNRKAKRGLISFGLSIFHTLIFIAYLFNKDLTT